MVIVTVVTMIAALIVIMLLMMTATFLMFTFEVLCQMCDMHYSMFYLNSSEDKTVFNTHFLNR